MKLPAPYGALAIASLCYKVWLAPYSACKETKTIEFAKLFKNCKNLLVFKTLKG